MLQLVTEENLLKSIYFIDRVVYPCVLLTSYNLRFIIQEHFFTYDDSKLFSLKLQSSLVLEGKCSEVCKRNQQNQNYSKDLTPT